MNSAGTALVYAGYIGGSGFDVGNGIAVDSAGNAYVTGYSDSTEADFPVIDGPDLTSNGGNDAFVAKVNPAGSALVYAGYIGGTGSDLGFGIAVDSAGNAYVAGRAGSDQASFPNGTGFASLPGLPGPDLTFNTGLDDAFVAKIAATAAASFTLTVTGAGNGAGTVTATGIACSISAGLASGDCTELYAAGTPVPLTPVATVGSTFAGWSGDPDCTDGTVTMDASKTCTATFTLVPAPPTVTNGPPPGGTVGIAYSFTYTSTGSPTFSVTAGSLPPGLTLSLAGVISGTPTTTGTFTGTVTATNGTAQDATQDFAILISLGGAEEIPTLSSWGAILLVLSLLALRCGGCAGPHSAS